MTTTMATEPKVRIVVQAPDELRQALRLEAAKRNVDMSDLVVEVLYEVLADSLAEVRKRQEGGKKGGK